MTGRPFNVIFEREGGKFISLLYKKDIMEEEVTKHTKKIYKALRIPGHSLSEKIKEISIEIFIIVFAVTLSISLHGWSDHRREQNRSLSF